MLFSDLPVLPPAVLLCCFVVGTSAVYLLGASEVRPGGVKALSFGSFLTRAVHLLEFLDFSAIKTHFDLRLDHWRLSGRRVPWRESLWNLVKGLSGFSILTDDHLDSAPHCVTPTYLADINSHFIVQHPTSFYTSYVTTHPHHHIAPQLIRTLLGEFFHGLLFRSPSPSVSLPSQSLPLILLHHLMQGYTGGKAAENLTGMGLEVADWRENDGVVSTISQGHPFVCTACQERIRRRVREREKVSNASTYPPSADLVKPLTAPDAFSMIDTIMDIQVPEFSAKTEPTATGVSGTSSPHLSSSNVCFHCTLRIDTVDHGLNVAGAAQTISESEWERGVRKLLIEDDLLCDSSSMSSFVPAPSVSDTRGAWVSFEVSDVTHVGLVVHPPSVSFQRAFFSHLWARIDAIDREVETKQQQ